MLYDRVLIADPSFFDEYINQGEFHANCETILLKATWLKQRSGRAIMIVPSSVVKAIQEKYGAQGRLLTFISENCEVITIDAPTQLEEFKKIIEDQVMDGRDLTIIFVRNSIISKAILDNYPGVNQCQPDKCLEKMNQIEKQISAEQQDFHGHAVDPSDF